MGKYDVRRGLLWTAVLTLCLATAPPAGAQAAGGGPQAAALEHFTQGIKHYRMGEHAKAVAAFDEVMKLKPNSRTALMMREVIGLDQLVKLLADDRYGTLAHEILVKAGEEAKAIRRDPKAIREQVKELRTPNLRERWLAVQRLVAVGPFAVPYLLPYFDVAEGKAGDAVTAQEAATMRAGASITISRMGARAVMPLVEALKSDSTGLKSQVCAFLGKAGDIRAVPMLLKVAEDEKVPAELRQDAHDAIVAILGDKAPAIIQGGAALAYYTLGEGYYYADPAVTDYVPHLLRVIWNWNSAGKDFPRRLTFREMPQYTYNELMAEKLLYEGFGTIGAGLNYLGLLAANNYRQLIEARHIASGAKTIGNRPVAPEEAKEAAARAKRLEMVRLANRLLGTEALHLALYRALADNHEGIARLAIADLRALTGARHPGLTPAEVTATTLGRMKLPEGQFNALVAALESRIPSVSFEATETIFRVDPLGLLGGQDRAVANTIRLMRTRIRPIILVITPDREYFKFLSGLLHEIAVHPVHAFDFTAGSMRAKEQLPAITMILVDSRTKDAGIGDIVDLFQADVRSKFMPILVAAPDADVADIKQVVGGRAQVISQASKPIEMKKKVNEILARPDAKSGDSAKYERYLLQILNALDDVPAGTGYPLRGMVPALTGLLTWYPDAFRLPAARILGNVAEAKPLPQLMKLYLSDETVGPLRIVAGNAALSVVARGGRLTADEISASRKLIRAAKVTVKPMPGSKAKMSASDVAAALKDIGMRLVGVTPADVETRKDVARDYRPNP